ncbi:UNVERIFIED_CONTAM: Ace [Trichonephila clavipes]
MIHFSARQHSTYADHLIDIQSYRYVDISFVLITGYKNKASFLISEYEDLDFVKSIAEEVKKLTPLYKEIHAYVRRKLMKFYKNETIMKDGPIPAHLLGTFLCFPQCYGTLLILNYLLHIE